MHPPQEQAEYLLPIKHDVTGQQHLWAGSGEQQQLVLLDNEAPHVSGKETVELVQGRRSLVTALALCTS